MQSGGEMGGLFRGHDWAKTALGAAENWPQSLRTAVSIILNSRFPMALFWGQELVFLYNDAYRQFIGNDKKHPTIFGLNGPDAWPEVWEHFAPMLNQVITGGEATWVENQPAPMYRNGRLEDAYWTYSHSAIIGESGTPAGVLVTFIDATGPVKTHQKLSKAHERLENIFTQISAGIAQADNTGKFITVNDRYCQMLGYTKEELLQKTFSDITHPDDIPVCEELVYQCIHHGKDFSVSKRYIRKDGSVMWVTNSVSLITDEDGNKFITGVTIDDTQGKNHELKLIESEVRFRTLAEQAPIYVFLSDINGTVEYWNPQWLEFVGQTFDEAIGNTGWQKTIHPDDLQRLSEIYYTSVAAGLKYSVEVRILHHDGQYRTLLFHGEPRHDVNGIVNGYIGSGVDITMQAEARQAIEASEAKFRSLIEYAPVATCLFVGPELVIEVANDIMIGYWGKDRSVIGKPLAVGVPELIGQPFLDILSEIYRTGIPYKASDAPAQLNVNGVLTTYYFDYTYQPLFDANGNVYAIMDMATDVTAQTVARKTLEETELKLREAVELAQLATWHINLERRHVVYSDRLREWVGMSERELQLENSPVIHPKDIERVTAAFSSAMDPNGTGLFDAIYSIAHLHTGQERIIHATGRTTFNADGKPISIAGTAQDVTVQKEMQLALENEVQKRTLELGAVNEKLRTINEQLADANRQLVRSNEELAQYAYVASHDLQEPLRKIQVFTDMLRRQTVADTVVTSLTGKIEKSALRMSLLIKDLLTFSRLLNADTLLQPVSLNEIVEQVLNDFELVRVEKGARVVVSELPEIVAIRLQMNQLFYNLIGNALKFIKDNVRPEIHITSSLLPAAEIQNYIKTPLAVPYYHITIADNGIGFDSSYAEQIFEVFKRLHGREIYPGSGIGLALCRRIVNNHKGHLFADSIPNEGTTIHIILPGGESV